MASTDWDLVQQARRGDREAFRTLVERYQHKVTALATGMLRNRDDALDVVQDTFVVALESLESFDERASLHAWLCGIARNKIRAERRKLRPRPLADVLAESDPQIDAILADVAREPLPEAVLEREETRELVGATLSSLTPEYRAALIARYVEGRSVEEIGARLGIGSTAAQSLLARAREAFRQAIETVFGAAARDIREA